MNANRGPEILKIQRDIIGETQQYESGPEILKIQRDLISKVWQRDSGPQILKNQLSVKFGDVTKSGPEILVIQKLAIKSLNP